jgi:hypothetical protein
MSAQQSTISLEVQAKFREISARARRMTGGALQAKLALLRSAIEGLDVRESTWAEWDAAYEQFHDL